MEPGDVIIIVKEVPNSTFKRKGADLLLEKEITLEQALTGVDFALTHLDGSRIRVKNNPGEVIKPDEVKTIMGKGLPFHKQSYKYGNLFVSFKVKFPTKLSAGEIDHAKKALASMPKPDTSMECKETCTLQAYSES